MGDSDQTLKQGAKVGDYTIADLIARGGFGAVYSCRDANGDPAALKILHQDRVTRESVERFHREVHVLKQIEHPNVVRFFDVGLHEDGRPFMVTELLSGVSLRERAMHYGRMPLIQCLEYLAPLVSALAATHAKGVVHRDIKVSNVFLAEENDGERVVLLDFGVAKLGDVGLTALTTSRHMVGTPTAMAPEQIGRGNITARTDVYGLGALMFRLLTGRNPFPDDAQIVMRMLQSDAALTRPSRFAPIPRAVDDVILRAMAKAQDKRQSSVEEFLREFRAAIEGEDTGLMAPEPPQEPASAAMAVYLEVLANEDDPEDEVLDDMEDVLAIGRDCLVVDGVDVVETGNSLLVVRCAGTKEQEAALTKLIWDMVSRLRNRAGQDTRVHFNVCVDRLEASSLRETRDKELTAITDWLPGEAVDGVVAKAKTADLLEAEAHRIPGVDGLFRIEDS